MKSQLQKLSAQRKTLIYAYDLKGTLHTQIFCQLGAAIGETYYDANLMLSYSTKRLLKESNIDEKSLHVTSICIYLFSCICGSTYVGRTEEIFYIGNSELLPKDLTPNGSELPTSAIGRNVVDRNQALKVITWVKNSQLLHFAEASVIWRIEPDLCVQKESIFILNTYKFYISYLSRYHLHAGEWYFSVSQTEEGVFLEEL